MLGLAAGLHKPEKDKHVGMDDSIYGRIHFCDSASVNKNTQKNVLFRVSMLEPIVVKRGLLRVYFSREWEVSQ